MALDIWTVQTGYTFGTLQERSTVNIQLPVHNDSGVIYSVISGSLPPGLRISHNFITGTPYEVPRDTTFVFCIRATKNLEISDRTFTILVSGVDAPQFITAEGLLPIHTNNLQYFVLDSSYVDFQLIVDDKDLATGQRLSFFIASGDGQLPTGLTLLDDGRLVGFIHSSLSIIPSDGNGTFDSGYYDSAVYDFGVRVTNGFDSYVYDTVHYDYSIPAVHPQKLNRNYVFYVSVTDGDTVVKRQFSIFVVGDDYFRADNTLWLNGSGVFTVDATYLRAPVWLTPANLGIARANNYLTISLMTYDTNNVLYEFNEVNADISAVTNRNTFTDNAAGSFNLTIKKTNTTPMIGQWLTFNGLFSVLITVISYIATSKKYQIISVDALGNNTYRLQLSDALEMTVPNDILFFIGSLSELPTGTSFDLNTARIYGTTPYQPAVTKDFKFTITAYHVSDSGEIARTARMFTMFLLGEVESIMTWNTSSDLGILNANFVSTLNISASSTISGSNILYKLISGRLPPGLQLDFTGEIIGKVNQYATTISRGLTTFDFALGTTFDNNVTSMDRIFEFTVQASDYLGYSAISKTFKIKINTPNNKMFSNLRIKPFLKLNQRSLWQSFINDTSIFTPNSIYRPNDLNFGLQIDLSMIVFAGIETMHAINYVNAISVNHKKKRFIFGNIKKAVAYIPGTLTPVYEIVYVQMIDPLEPHKKHLPDTIYSNNIEYYPSSISLWRERIATIGSKERNYLPLWMRSIQPGSKQELDFQLAVPLCYCKIGTADDIILNIKFNSFDFKSLDYTIDRYIIDTVVGESGDKYLIFKNDRITL